MLTAYTIVRTRAARVNRMGASDQEFRSHVIFFHRLNRDSNQDWPLF